MKHYSHERKAAILQKMAPPQSLTVAEVARQEGISTATLYNWRKAARERGAVLPSRSNAPGQWSSEEKFRVVLETASLSEAEFGEYCRSKGLQPAWVEDWRKACMGANASTDEQQRQSRQAVKAERQQIKKLQRELNYKDKALAETAALLTLSKKAKAIWGPKDEDE
jgi:transposase-like protein|tara:strand:+ start:3831 stop:4331 length:501 start_codon:yes stop_codon:yes gene_type:complete